MTLVLHSVNDPRVIESFMAGGVVVIPTDTIYGLAVRASDKKAVSKVANLKQGGDDYRPGTIVAASTQQLIDLGVDEQVVRSVQHLWPNPLSIELPIGSKLSYLYQDGPHRAFRVVADLELQSLLQKTGPLLTSSVNYHGEPPANNVQEATHYFGDRVDLYVDTGELTNPPSTLAKVQNGHIQVIRQGAMVIGDQDKA
jgi:L-threonylcarbamoyladenylate synthase